MLPVVHRKLHKGLVAIPFPDLPMPEKVARPQPIRRPLEKQIQPDKQPVIPRVSDKPVRSPNISVEDFVIPSDAGNIVDVDDTGRVKDNGKFMIEDMDYDDYGR